MDGRKESDDRQKLLSHGIVVVVVSLVNAGHVENVVATNDNLTKWTLVLLIDEFNRIA